jgi:hypothetical protein
MEINDDRVKNDGSFLKDVKQCFIQEDAIKIFVIGSGEGRRAIFNGGL